LIRKWNWQIDREPERLILPGYALQTLPHSTQRNVPLARQRFTHSM
jgi:hypothetical protein